MNSNAPINVPILAVTPEGFSDFLQNSSKRQILARNPAETPGSFAIRQGAWSEYVSEMAEESCGAVVDYATGICIQPVHGFIAAGCDPEEEAFCGCFDANRLSALATALSQDAGVKSLVLHINSPGGAVSGLAENCQAIVALQETRPDIAVFAYIEGMGCSAAARIAASCGETHAGIGAMVGSISTINVYYDDSRMFQNAGIDAKVFTDGKYKSAGYPGVPITDEQAALIDETVKAFGAEFKSFMAERRPGLTEEDMQGQAFFASFGKFPAALLDGIGWPSFDDFVATVATTLTHGQM